MSSGETITDIMAARHECLAKLQDLLSRSFFFVLVARDAIKSSYFDRRLLGPTPMKRLKARLKAASEA